MPTSDYETAVQAVKDIRARGWVHQGEPIQTAKGNWVLPQVRILTFHPNRPHKKNGHPYDAYFETEVAARKEMDRLLIDHFNLYRIDKVNGEWRTDW